MTKHEFLQRLEQGLRGLSPEDREDALAYYRDFLEEAGPEREGEVLQSFGDPAHLCAQIKAETAAKQLADAPSGTHSSLHVIFLTIGAIFAAPVALPLALAAVVVVVALIVYIFSVFLAVWAAAIGSGLVGIAAIVTSVPSFSLGLWEGLLLLGSGIAAASLGALILVPSITFARFCFRRLALCFSNIVLRRKNHEKK